MKTFPFVRQTLVQFRLMGLLLLTCLVPLGQAAFGQVVAWELGAEPGNQAISNSTTQAANFNVGILTRGPGVTAATGAGSMNSTGWFNSAAATSLGDAIANDEYYEFTVSTANCFFFNPTTINIVLRSSATGPNTATLFSSADGFSSSIGTVTVTTTSVEHTFSEAISPNSQSVTYRLYGYGGAAGGGTPGTGGTMRIGSSVVGSDNDIEVFATTTQLVLTPVSNITVNAGAVVPATVFSATVTGATFSWSRTGEPIGLPTTVGTGDVPSFTATNTGSTPITSTFSAVATIGNCNSVPIQFTITVNPPPGTCDIHSITVANAGPCNDNGTPGNPADDFFEADITVVYSNSIAGGDVRLALVGPDIMAFVPFLLPLPVGTNLSHTFLGVQLRADGQATNFEAQVNDPLFNVHCSLTTTGPAVAPCSGAPGCEVIGFSFANIGPCNDNGTPGDDTDDFFTVDIDVLYSNQTANRLVRVIGPGFLPNGAATADIGTNLTKTFFGMNVRANGQPIQFTGEIVDFNNNQDCSLPGTGPAVNSCSNGGPACEVIGFTFANIGSCNNNGTSGDPADDFFFADVDMIYTNSSNNQLLVLIGTDIISSPIVPAEIGSNITTTIPNVKFRATGQPVSFTGFVQFAGIPSECNLPGTGPAVNSCSNAPTNDDCPGAIPLACDQTVSGTLVNATPDSPFPICNTEDANTHNVWYSFTGTGNRMALSLCGQANVPNATMSVFTGSCSNLTCVSFLSEGNFDCGGFDGRKKLFQTTAGTQYFVRVAPFSLDPPGTYELTLHCYNPLPPNGAATVTCPALAVPPVTPTYTPGVCNPNVPIEVTPNAVQIINTPNPLTCEGTRRYAYSFQDCLGFVHEWVFLYTIERQPFTLPPNGAATVACLSQAVQPTPPTVLSNCGEVLAPLPFYIINSPDPLTCEGTRTFYFGFRDCEANEALWSFTYTIERQPFTITTPNAATTVNCPANLPATVTPPTVQSNCGETLTPTGPVITNVPNPVTCEGTRTFTFTYTDCEGNTATWSHVFTVERQPFTVPANTASTVACPSQITQPVPPTVLSNCGEVLTPTGPVILNGPNPLTCEGIRTFTFTYTDCEGNTAQWSHVTTIEREPFTIPVPNGTATVDCPDDSDAQPTPPVVLSNCGELLTPVLINTTAKPGCEGHRVYTFRYTDCEGNFADWLFTYLVEYQDFAVPQSEMESLECPILATEPVPPTVLDNCGNLLNPTGPVVTSTENAQGCEGSRQYAWTYKDCEGNTHIWSKTYQFLYSADFFVFSDETNEVACLAYAVQPFPPTLYDACGQEIKAVLTNVTEDIAASGCTGWRKFEFEYTDCGGHSHPWRFTYEINDNEAPMGTCPSGNGGAAPQSGPMAVSVTNLSCIEEVPCPYDHDFSEKIAELLVVGNYFDVCSGNDLVVELQGASDLWQCGDPDGDGIYSFGRTFYFRIADPCGNEYPGGCEITYSGECLPIETFRQEEWGITGAMPGNAVNVATSDLSVIANLLNGDPLTIGGGNRSITLTDPQCVVDLLPGTGGPSVLANCHQANCTGCNPMGVGGMKNSLAANAIALSLNLRFNNEYKGLEMSDLHNQSLGCIQVHECILDCHAGGCQLRIFDQNGMAYEFPNTLGGLLDLTNHFLDGGLPMSIGQKTIYGTAINQALLDLNAEWSGLQAETACDQEDEIKPIGDESQSFGNGSRQASQGMEFSLSPNPTSRYVWLRIGNLEEECMVQFELFSTMGDRLIFNDLGKAASLQQRIELSSLKTGMYLVVVKVEGYRPIVEKLFVNNEMSLNWR